MRLRRREYESLERELRAARPEPRDEFVRSVAKRLHPRERIRVAPRIALAGALTVALLVVVAAIGGTATVAPFANLGHLAERAVAPANNGTSNGNGDAAADANDTGDSSISASQDQYKFLVCHHPRGNPSNFRTLSVGSQAAVDAIVRHSPGSHPGPCGPNG